MVVAALGSTPGAAAQVRASERATVSQVVDGTVIEVDYARPRLRGRTAFGGVVHWGEMWTPGANWATTLRVSRAVRLEGRPLPAGRYSVWVVPTPDAWTVGLHWEPRLYHLQRPQLADLFMTVPVTPTSGPSAELLTFSFPETRRDGATLRFEWGTTRFGLRIDTDRTAATRPPLTPEQTAPFVGTYTAWLYGETGDSTRMEQRLFLDDGRLKGEITGTSRTFELIRVGERQFLFELWDGEGPLDVELDGPVVFTVNEIGRATGFRMRGIEQPLWMRAVRVR
jgi:hypothetical protein